MNTTKNLIFKKDSLSKEAENIRNYLQKNCSCDDMWRVEQENETIKCYFIGTYQFSVFRDEYGDWYFSGEGVPMNTVQGISNLLGKETPEYVSLSKDNSPSKDEQLSGDGPLTEIIEIASKNVEDIDGFLTDYTMYRNTKNGKYFFILGDKEIYTPGSCLVDFVCDTETEAWEWYDSYTRVDEDEEIEMCEDYLDKENEREER